MTGPRVRATVEVDQQTLATVAAVSTWRREPVSVGQFRRSLEQDGAAERVLGALVALAMAPHEILP